MAPHYTKAVCIAMFVVVAWIAPAYIPGVLGICESIASDDCALVSGLNH